MAKKHQSHIAYSWQTFDPNRVIFGPSKMLSLHVIEWGCEITETLQIPIDTKVLNARWAKHHGNMYRSSLVVCVKVQSEIPVFHKIHHVIVHDERLLLVTFVLQTMCLDEHFNAFKVVYNRPHVVDVKELFCYKAFDIQMSYSCDDASLFIVPYCFL